MARHDRGEAGVISVVLYGRNDSYGYNLHKRAALSLNCIAELLTHETDEILFVDYNTPNDFPTFPEAIQDTLTPRARKLLRILRVRPNHHQRFRNKTHLVALEPVARNVAVRRSNPANRWILSTNTDMVFVPRNGRSLSDIVNDLPDGLYHLPRFEIPESLWESLDRLDAAGTIARVRAWGRTFHLNEVVHAHDPWVKFDGPGDFQLMPRADLFRISGFHEEMLLGWHVDSNIARRFYLLYGQTRDLLDELYGYHCDHTRQVTPAHRWGAVQNDMAKFSEQVMQPELPEQARDWGLADQSIEELTAEQTSRLYVDGLKSAITRELLEPSQVAYSTATYDKVDYDVPHVLPFLTDILASYPRDTRIGWFGSRPELLVAFTDASREMGYSLPVLVATGAAWLGETLPNGCLWSSPDDVIGQAEVFVFDCGLLPGEHDADPERMSPSARFIAHGLRLATHGETVRLRERPGMAARRFIAVNAIHNRFEGMVASRINAARSPVASRIRQGFVILRDFGEVTDLLAQFATGDAGKRHGDGIVAAAGKPGYVVFGPYLDLDPGTYRLDLTFRHAPDNALKEANAAVLEIFADPYYFSVQTIALTNGEQTAVSATFNITRQHLGLFDSFRIEFRLRTRGRRSFTLTGATIRELPGSAEEPAYDLLPLLVLGPAAARDKPATSIRDSEYQLASSSGVNALSGTSGFVVFGPYITLPPGSYEAVVRLRATFTWRKWIRRRDNAIMIDVVAEQGTVFLARLPVTAVKRTGSDFVLEFVIDRGTPVRNIEFRVYTNGSTPFVIEALHVRPSRTAPPAVHDDACSARLPAPETESVRELL